MFDTMSVARKIREARISLNMTQMNLADAMEVSYQAVSNWERGNSMPDISKLELLCRILDIKHICYTAIFFVQEVIVIIITLKLIPVAHIGAEEIPTERLCCLIGIRSFRIRIVHLQSHLPFRTEVA